MEPADVAGVGAVPAEASAPVPSAEAAPEAAPDESTGIWAKIGVATGLGGLAVASKYAEYKGYDRELVAPERWVVDSTAHPVFGYMGAWAATALGRRRESLSRFRSKIAFAGATAANFAVEGAQSVTVATSQYVEFWAGRNTPETTKDYFFALAGLGLYLWQERRK